MHLKVFNMTNCLAMHMMIWQFLVFKHPRCYTRVTGYSTRMEAGSRGSVATKARCRAAGRAPRRRRGRAVVASGRLGHGGLGLRREPERKGLLRLGEGEGEGKGGSQLGFL